MQKKKNENSRFKITFEKKKQIKKITRRTITYIKWLKTDKTDEVKHTILNKT